MADTFSLIERVANTAIKVGQLAGAPSSTLLDSNKPYRVEPYFLIEENIRDTEYVKQLVPHLLTVFIGAYVQTVNVLGAAVSRVESIRFMDSINPDRSYYGTESDASYPVALHGSSYNYGLPAIGAMSSQVQMESSGNVSTASTNAVANLAVGREVLVTTGAGDQQQQHVINFRAIPMSAGRRAIINWLSTNVTNTGTIDRWNSVLDGKINLISDFIFCNDVLREYRRGGIAAGDKAIEKVKARRNKVLSASLVNRRLPLAAASSFYIISRNTADEIEIATGIDFSRAGKRDAYMEKGAAMGIVIVDEDRGLVNVYYKDVPGGAELTLSELRGGNRKDSVSDELLAAVVATLRTSGNPSAF